ncbi:MAG TPA: hypothetical protein VI968_01305 [archaeon]|nr:hypothetical protein [archaeon]
MRNRCKHLTLTLNCLEGGEGRIICIDPKFHNQCIFKKTAEQKEAERTGRALNTVLDLN